MILKDLPSSLPHKYADLLRLLNSYSQNKEYRNNTVANGLNILIIGKKAVYVYMKEMALSK